MKSLDVVKDVDTVYHLAALYSTKTDRATVEDLVTSNIIFSLNIIHSIIEKNPKCKFVSTSTFSSFDENYNYAPASFYAATKTAVEILAQTYPVSTTFLRLPDTYGTDDWRPKVHNLLRDAVRHKEKSFTFMKPGEQVMNLIHVEDVVRALLHSADLLRGNTVTKTVYDLFYPENAMELGELGDYLIKGSQTHLVFPLFGRIDPVPPQKHVLPEFELLHSPHIDLAETLLK
jgi:nucleoside-diphosphate-sugar epimerase